MKKISLKMWGLINPLATLIYVFLVVTIMLNIERVFGKIEDNILSPIVFLMLFVFFAFITGLLLLGRPV